MDRGTVLLVEPVPTEVEQLSESLSAENRDISVRVLAQLPELYDEFTTSVVHCLVLPAAVGETDAGRIARACADFTRTYRSSSAGNRRNRSPTNST